jgi:hypothetical protein
MGHLRVTDIAFLAFDIGRFFRNMSGGTCILLFLGVAAAVGGAIYVYSRLRGRAGVEGAPAAKTGDLQEKLQHRRERIMEERQQRREEIPHGPLGKVRLPAATLMVRNRVEPVVSDREFTIGKGKENTLTIVELGVSRRHAKIRPQPNGYMLYDLVSSTGTFLNGKRIEQSVLHDGDKIRIGPETLVFGLPDK